MDLCLHQASGPRLSTPGVTSLRTDWERKGKRRASLVAQRLKRLTPMQETWVRSLGQEDPLEKEMATHSSILAWRISWTEDPGRLQSTGWQRVGYDWATSLSLSRKARTELCRAWMPGCREGRAYPVWLLNELRPYRLGTGHWEPSKLSINGSS